MRSRKPFHTVHILALKTWVALKHWKLGLPTGIGIATTTACNRRCHYCPQSKNPTKQQIIAPRVWTTFVERLQDVRWRGVTSITFYGEPSLDEYAVDRVASLAAIGCWPLIFTNGDRPEFIERVVRAGARRVVVTEHPPYTPEWQQKVYPIARRYPRVVDLKKLDQIIWRPTERTPIRVNDEDIHTCRWSHSMSITPAGDVMSCCMDYDMVTNQGSILTEGLWDIWFKPEFRALRRLADTGQPNALACKKCLGTSGIWYRDHGMDGGWLSSK